MNPFQFLSAWYHAIARHRKKFFFLICLLLAGCAAVLTQLQVREDIGMVFPEDDTELAYSIGLMELAPFSRMVFIQLEAATDTPPEQLLQQAQRLRADLPDTLAPSMNADVVPDPHAFLALLPSLANDAVMDALDKQANSSAYEAAMRENYLSLSGAGSMIAKRFMRYDPFHLLSPLFGLLRSYRMADDLTIQDGFQVKDGGRKLLLLARSSLAPTDSGNSEVMLQELQGVIQNTVASENRVTVFCGHQFAVENARTVKRDLRVVLGVSLLGLVVIFVCFIRSKDILWVAVVPAIVLLVASAALTVLFPVVSGITLGFGAVLLGISVDFSLHVYFALHSSTHSVARTISEVARPVLFGGLTSLAAFGVLAVSAMPGIQQLGWFGIIGLSCGLFLALVVLPHCLHPKTIEGQHIPQIPVRQWNAPLAVVVCCVLFVSLLYGAHVRMDGSLRSLGVFPPQLLKAEEMVREEWGGKNEWAVFFAEGKSKEEAIARSSALLSFLQKNGQGEKAYSLSRLMPATDKRAQNRARWDSFAKGRADEMLAAIEAAQHEYGFSAMAFAPFAQWLSQPLDDISFSSLDDAGLSALVSLLYAERGEHKYLLTLVPKTQRIRELALSEELPEGVYFYSASLLGEKLGEAFSGDFTLFVTLAFVSMSVFLLLFFRNIRLSLLAMLPLLCGMSALLCVMRATGTPFNLFSIAALPLIIGLTADYGIFIVNACCSGVQHGTSRAVLVSGLTTIAGFGALVFAEHPAMYALGSTVLLGVGVAVPVAIFLVPKLYYPIVSDVVERGSL